MILKTDETDALQPADFLSEEEAVLADTEALVAVADSAADTPVVVAADALVADTDNTNPNTQLKTITNR